MSISQGIYWSEGENSEFVSYVPGVDLQKKNMNPSLKKPKGSRRKMTSVQFLSEDVQRTEDDVSTSRSTAAVQSSKSKSGSANSSYSSKTHRASLKDLCPEDKTRVANLVRELAKAGEDKEAIEKLLNNERKQFDTQLFELKADKARIETEQKNILSQFNDCQKLLVFYQKKIADEQKEVARDISRLLSESPLSRPNSVGLRMRPSLRYPTAAALDDDITVREIEEGMHTHRSSVDSSPNTRNNVALGHSFRRIEENRKLLRSPQQSNLAPQFVVVGRDKSPRKRAHFLNDLPPFEHTDAAGTPSDTTDDVCDQEGIQRFSSSDSTSEDYLKDKTSEVKQRRRSTSPLGRRELLMNQKRELECQQAQLQKLLVEQENILKFRQTELKRRHEEYNMRKYHLERSSNIPSVPTDGSKSIAQSGSSPDQSSDLHQPNTYSPDMSAIANSPRKDPFLPSKSLLPDLSRLNCTPTWTDDFTKLEGVQDSFSAAEANTQKPNDSSFQSLVGRSPDTSGTKEPDSVMASPLSQSRGSASYFCGNVTSNRSQRPIRTCDVCYEQSVQRLDVSDRESFRQRPVKERPVRGEDSSATSHVVIGSRMTDPGRISKDNTLTEEELLSSTFTSSRPSTHHKMNNISTLSHLVSSPTFSETMYSLKPERSSLSPLARSKDTDNDVTTTFDPEDSQLLEDIFFIN